jgi:hypothetical protein
MVEGNIIFPAHEAKAIQRHETTAQEYVFHEPLEYLITCEFGHLDIKAPQR